MNIVTVTELVKSFEADFEQAMDRDLPDSTAREFTVRFTRLLEKLENAEDGDAVSDAITLLDNFIDEVNEA